MRRLRRALGISVLGALGCACVPAGDGVTPPPERIYFPVGLQIDAASEWLYVVNSDFDLQYSQGTVQSYDLVRLRRLLRTPCSADSDCDADQRCDTEPTPENLGEPSFFCVASIGEQAGRPCGALAESDASTRAISPGRCAPLDPAEPGDGEGTLLGDVVGISAFATGGQLVRSPPGLLPGGQIERLFIPVRGDLTLHWMDVSGGQIDCGQTDDPESDLPRCGDLHKIDRAPDFIQRVQPEPDPDEPEDDSTYDPEELEVAPEPYEFASTPDGRVLALTHQSFGRVSTFINDWVAPPFLVDQLEAGVASPMYIAAIPEPRVVEERELDYQAGFLMTTRSAPTVSLLRFFDDGAFALLEQAEAGELRDTGFDQEARPRLVEVDVARIRANSSGIDSRGIVIDDSARKAAEAACAEGDADCLEAASRVTLAVYVANRSPNSLLVGSTSTDDSPVATSDLPTFHDNIPLTQGPSRVYVGPVTGPDGRKEQRVFVLCFDSALIYVYDPERRIVEAEIATGRGPHAIAFDAKLPLLYIAHFTDSYLGVVSLDQRQTRTYGAMVGAVGTPTPPRAAK